MIRIAALIVVSAYSGAIISSLMQSTHKMPFMDLDGLVRDGTYKISTFADSFNEYYFKVKVVLLYNFKVKFNRFQL